MSASKELRIGVIVSFAPLKLRSHLKFIAGIKRTSQALEFCISFIPISDADDKLDGVIAVTSKGVVRYYAHFATFPIVRANKQ
jgi:hypothetical protein